MESHLGYDNGYTKKSNVEEESSSDNEVQSSNLEVKSIDTKKEVPAIAKSEKIHTKNLFPNGFENTTQGYEFVGQTIGLSPLFFINDMPHCGWLHMGKQTAQEKFSMVPQDAIIEGPGPDLNVKPLLDHENSDEEIDSCSMSLNGAGEKLDLTLKL